MSIAIVTDTDCSLPLEITRKHSILQVPITVHFGEEVLETGIDIDDAALFQRVDEEGVLPTTSAPSPGKFGEVYQKAFDGGASSVICICVSGEVSATYGAALAAAGMMKDRDITVLDSQTLTMGQGFMVMAAAEAADAGMPKERVIRKAEDIRDRTHLFAALSTLKYLAMSGRVSHLAAGMANILNVKPILTIREGKLDLLERVRTKKKSWDRIIELTREMVGDKVIERMAIFHVHAREDAAEFEKIMRTSLSCPEAILMSELTPGLSVHSGAGMVGVSFVVEA
jgi:DegV family protein with EDD domain